MATPAREFNGPCPEFSNISWQPGMQPQDRVAVKAVSEEEVAMATNEKTSAKAGKAASKVLKSKSTGKDSKTAAGSALSQRPDKK